MEMRVVAAVAGMGTTAHILVVQAVMVELMAAAAVEPEVRAAAAMVARAVQEEPMAEAAELVTV